MKPYDLKVTGFVEIGAKDSDAAIDQFNKWMQNKFPVADLRWKTVSLASAEEKESLEIIQNLANENHGLKLEIKNHTQQTETMQAEIDQLRLLVYFQGNAVLNQLLKLIDTEFRPEDRNSNYIRNALLRKIVGHVQTVNKQLDGEATKAFQAYLDHQRAEELDRLYSNLFLMSDNARENGYHKEADTIHDVCDAILERMNLLRDDE